MKMTCPQCQTAFDNRLVCPQCAVALVYPGQGEPNRAALVAFARSDAYPQVPTDANRGALTALPVWRQAAAWLALVGVFALAAGLAWLKFGTGM